MKSIEVKFNEALAAIDKLGKREVFNEKVTAKMPIETQLNLAETILKESRVVRKYNGATDNGHDFSEAYVQENHNCFSKGDRIMAEAAGLSDEQIRRVEGRPPAEIEALGEKAIFEYRFCLGCRLTEAQAIASVKKQFRK